MPNWSNTAPKVDIPCSLCQDGGTRYRIADTVWGMPGSFVCRCSACEIVFIHPTMMEEEEKQFYSAEFAHYMKERGGPGETEPEEHFKKNQAEAKRRLVHLQPYLRSSMRVLEIGSSTGFLLAAVEPYVASITGVEPGKLYADYANRRGIRTVSNLYEVAKERFDLILAYYVIEHLQRPVRSLAKFRDMLQPGGLLAMEVPNVDDALVRFYQLESFDRFYWQKAHYFNYSHRTLARVLEQAGFRFKMFPEQRYDLSNHIHWLLTGQPGGKGKYSHLFDWKLDQEYARCLKTRWLCDTIFSVATKFSETGPVPVESPKTLPLPVPGLSGLYRTPEPSAQENLIRLNRNERQQPLPEQFMTALRQSFHSRLLTHYPVTHGLYQQLSAWLGIPEEQLLLTAGSDAAIKALYQAYVQPGDTVVMLDPSYAMYEVYAQMFHAKARKISFNESLVLDGEQLVRSVSEGVRLVMIANPNQPTATLLGEDVLLQLADRTASVGALLVVDEAYYPFSRTTILPWIKRFPHLVAIRSFSKAAGLAGLRIGFSAGHPEVMSHLSKVRSVHDINSIAIMCLGQLLKQPQIMDDYVAQVEAGGQWLAKRAQALGLIPLPTHTNFMLLRVAGRCDPSQLVERLRYHGYLVKGPFDSPCLANCIRVTLGPPDLMEAFSIGLARSLSEEG